MRIVFVMPSIGRKAGTPYVRTWQMEPLAIAQLKALTPPRVETGFYDDRVEAVDFTDKPDLVAITAETYTARRAYHIADTYRGMGIPVVLGGYHPTLMPDEAALHADAVVVGEAEGVWAEVVDDAAARKLKPLYRSEIRPDLGGLFPDRTIFAGKGYLPLSLVETGRGCYHSCNFCSIASFYRSTFNSRPPDDIVREIVDTGARTVFFIDDNIAADPASARELFTALKRVRVNWVSQISILRARDEELLDLMAESGCMGVLIGFESLNSGNLVQMGKSFNSFSGGPGQGGPVDYSSALKALRKRGIVVYGTFLFGYDHDTRATFEETLDFAIDNRLFLAAFNHLVPFPGTGLYHRLESEGRLLYDRWWLSPEYRFGDVAFAPAGFSASELSEICLRYRRRFYSASSILRRALDVRGNLGSAKKAAIFGVQNFLAHREVGLKQGLPLGFEGG